MPLVVPWTSSNLGSRACLYRLNPAERFLTARERNMESTSSQYIQYDCMAPSAIREAGESPSRLIFGIRVRSFVSVHYRYTYPRGRLSSLIWADQT